MIFIGPPRRLSQAGVTAGVTSGNRVEWNTENVDGRNHCVDGSVSADEPLALLRWSVSCSEAWKASEVLMLTAGMIYDDKKDRKS